MVFEVIVVPLVWIEIDAISGVGRDGVRGDRGREVHERFPSCTITPSPPLDVIVFAMIVLPVARCRSRSKMRCPRRRCTEMVLPAPAAGPPIVLFEAPSSMLDPVAVAGLDAAAERGGAGAVGADQVPLHQVVLRRRRR